MKKQFVIFLAAITLVLSHLACTSSNTDDGGGEQIAAEGGDASPEGVNEGLGTDGTEKPGELGSPQTVAEGGLEDPNLQPSGDSSTAQVTDPNAPPTTDPSAENATNSNPPPVETLANNPPPAEQANTNRNASCSNYRGSSTRSCRGQTCCGSGIQENGNDSVGCRRKNDELSLFCKAE
jgi:hypothetical protein